MARGTDTEILSDLYHMIPTEDLIEELSQRVWDADAGLAALASWRNALETVEDALGQAREERRDHRAAMAQHGA